jgi:hypothetical protein
MADWVKTFGEQVGTELGRVIGESLQRTLLSSIDVGDIARRIGGGLGAGRRGRRASGQKAMCSEPGCPNPVLAKGLCRSHYYRARYRAQTGANGRGRRGAKADAPGPKKRRGRRTKTAAEPATTAETAAS